MKTVSDEAYELLQQIADFIRYDLETDDMDKMADAMETANWCIERSREVLDLPAESEGEREIREDDEDQNRDGGSLVDNIATPRA